MNVELFMQTLPYMAKGMLGIFAVTLVLVACILLLNRLTSRKKDTGDQG